MAQAVLLSTTSTQAASHDPSLRDDLDRSLSTSILMLPESSHAKSCSHREVQKGLFGNTVWKAQHNEAKNVATVHLEPLC